MKVLIRNGMSVNIGDANEAPVLSVNTQTRAPHAPPGESKALRAKSFGAFEFRCKAF